MADTMQDVLAAPPMPTAAASDVVMAPMPVNPAAAPVAADLPTATPEVVATETLYIQNLNERIKIPGACSMQVECFNRTY